jgi:hypothetical protein
MNIGFEDGYRCNRTGDLNDQPPCEGILELRPSHGLKNSGCSCFICPPCSYCMSKVAECPACNWRDEEPS